MSVYFMYLDLNAAKVNFNFGEDRTTPQIGAY